MSEGLTVREWDPSRLSSGVYFVRALMGSKQETRRLVYLGGR
jgi:hypothetical protein